MHRLPFALALGLGILSGCGSATIRECRLQAIEDAVPVDPGLVTVDDVVAVIHKLAACKATASNGGAPPQ